MRRVLQEVGDAHVPLLGKPQHLHAPCAIVGALPTELPGIPKRRFEHAQQAEGVLGTEVLRKQGRKKRTR